MNSILRSCGDNDAVLDIGETCAYVCETPDVQSDTFSGDENEICVQGDGQMSGTRVDDCDTTRVYTDDPLNPVPQIALVKRDDETPSDDRQEITESDVAIFLFEIANVGSEDLERVSLDDIDADACDRSVEDLLPLIRAQ